MAKRNDDTRKGVDTNDSRKQKQTENNKPVTGHKHDTEKFKKAKTHYQIPYSY